MLDTNTNMEQAHPMTDSLKQLIERLKPLHVILSQNSYVRDATRRLKRIIEDAENQTMILLLGKERVGKTTLINALLGRDLLSVDNEHPTSVNTFIRYGEKECIKAIFLDGIVATFDIGKIELLTTSDNFGAQIIREHLDFLEIYIKHDLLKEVTIIDSVALEFGATNTAFFSPALLSRVDEIFWVIRNGSVATEAEINLLTKLNNQFIEPHLLVNAIEIGVDFTIFMGAEKARYGHQLSNVQGVSARLAIDARKTNNSQLLIDSKMAQLQQLIHEVVRNKEKKTRHITERFIHWLERIRKEIELIPTREPFLSAFESIDQLSSDENLEFTRQQRDLAIIGAYEEEYKQVSTVFKPVQTLYQLLQVFASDLYLRDDDVERFELRAIRYQQLVREYRKLHSEHRQEYERLDAQIKKRNGQALSNQLIIQKETEFAVDRIATLNEWQQQMNEKLEYINKYEGQIIEELYSIQNRLNDLAMARLKSILQQVSDLNVQRKQERVALNSYVAKLGEFTCITEAQGFLRDAIGPYLVGDHLPLSDEEKLHVRNTIECIAAVDLTHEGLFNQAKTAEPTDITAQLEFETNYKLHGLSLTETDILSQIPEVPAVIEIIEES